MSYATEAPNPQNEALRRQALCNWVRECVAHSEQHYWSYRRQLPKIYDLYRGVRTNRFHVHKNSISVQLLYTIVWSHAARIMNMIFGQTPAIRYFGLSGDEGEAGIARKFDALFAGQFADCRGLEKCLDMLINANLYGQSVATHGWKYERGKVLVPSTEAAPLSETTVQTFLEREVVNFDGPDFVVRDNLDCAPQPGFKYETDMRWFFYRYYLDIEQVEALSKDGNTREPIFDPLEVRLLKNTSSGSFTAADSLKNMRGLGLFQAGDATARQREKYGRPVEVWEGFGVHVPSGLTPSDASSNFRVITIANGQFVLRDKTFPLLLNKRPIVVASLNPDPHFFFGPGRGEMVSKLQLGINKFTNQILDALDVSIDPWFIFDRSAGIDPRNLFLRPGRWIPMTGSPGEKIMPGNPNLQGLQAGMEMTQVLWQYMQRVSGILDESVIGVRAPGRSTARGDLARGEAVAVRLVLEALLFEKQVCEPLADAFMAHNKQFLSAPRQFLMLGQAATVDPVTKKKIQVERGTIFPNDLTKNYAAMAMGTQMRMIRSDRVQDLMLMTQILGSSPTLAAAASSAGWIRLIARELGVGHEVNDLLVDDPAYAQLIASAGGDLENVPMLNAKNGTPGAVGNLNTLSQMAGSFGGG